MLSSGRTNYRTFLSKNLRRQIASLAGRRLLLYPFYRQRTGGTEQDDNLPKIMQDLW